jgi:hypothetical protein
MQFRPFPLYCGGQLVIGLHTHPSADDNAVIRMSIDDQKNYHEAQNQNRHYFSQNCQYAPKDLIKFQQLIRRLSGYDASNEIQIGSLIAVTNGAELLSAEHLQKTGFKLAGRFNKNDFYANNGNNITGYAWCAMWVGDWRNDIRPILHKVPKWEDPNEIKPKFR